MGLLSFLSPSHAEIAALRDENIRLGTENVLLRDLVEHPPQPRRTRERRKDAADIREARELMTASLREALRPALGKHRGRE
jgi:hypothetical protein